eukprot:CAMPEP_0182462464 /NCGR_PEP_ID=MMETSP1319-20130603/6721_1 /TAXON_ID=172717 /ORGANISM="Bolidomonas pacifica, Strain RCC208" /LENGTH=51 /DNA_ID=CAMNT_0024661899 /DNA_START=515 /DNA_END=670 /DNA_ORIENTATION=-
MTALTISQHSFSVQIPYLSPCLHVVPFPDSPFLDDDKALCVAILAEKSELM